MRFIIFLQLNDSKLEFKVSQNTGGYKQIDFGNSQHTQAFYQLARRLETILAIRFNKKSDHFNTLSWNYSYHGVPFILRYHWDSGTLIQLESKSPSTEEQNTLEDIVTVLQEFL